MILNPCPTIATPLPHNSSITSTTTTTATTTATAIKISNNAAVLAEQEVVAVTAQTTDILLVAGGVTVTIITLGTTDRSVEDATCQEKNTFSIWTVLQVTESQVIKHAFF